MSHFIRRASFASVQGGERSGTSGRATVQATGLRWPRLAFGRLSCAACLCLTSASALAQQRPLEPAPGWRALPASSEPGLGSSERAALAKSGVSLTPEQQPYALVPPLPPLELTREPNVPPSEPALGAGRYYQLEPGRTPPVNKPLFSKEVGLGIIAGIYGVVYTWTYFAWYKNRATTEDIVFEDEGLFGPDTYAGGNDKLGHAWGNYIINRWTANVLATGGWGPGERSLISTSTTMAFFTMIELKDGYHKGFGFSWWDMAANTVGNGLAVAMNLSPRLDDMFDFKVYYLPTRSYLRSLTQRGVVDAGEDYSGQLFTLTYHLTSSDAVKRAPALQWLRFLDVYLGFQSKNYLPKPVSPNTDRLQELSFGVALNVQHLLDVAYDWYERPRGHVHSSLRFFLEGFGIPYTNQYLIKYQKNNGPAPPDPESE